MRGFVFLPLGAEAEWERGSSQAVLRAACEQVLAADLSWAAETRFPARANNDTQLF